jgi:transposase
MARLRWRGADDKAQIKGWKKSAFFFEHHPHPGCHSHERAWRPSPHRLLKEKSGRRSKQMNADKAKTASKSLFKIFWIVETIWMRKSYPSDITRAQFEHIRPLLEGARKKTRPRQVDLYEVFCAVLYLLKSGCQWRMLPADFPDWCTTYAYFRIWRAPRTQGGSLLEQALKRAGWRGSRETGAQRLHHVLDRGRTECEEHRYGGSERL